LKKYREFYWALSLLFFGSVLISCASSNVHAPVYNQYTKGVISSAKSYLVRSGDTLYSIAWQSGHDYHQLAKWNNISWPYTIYKGQKIKLVAAAWASKKPAKFQRNNKKTVKKQKITKKSSKKYSKKVKLVWQWPINAKKLEKGIIKTGVVLVGRPGELVRSSESGKVVYAGNGLKGYGNLLIIMHKNEFLTAYGYNKRLLVKEGSVVKKGQAIAEIGMDSRQRRVLFFEIRQHGKAVSVTKHLPKIRG